MKIEEESENIGSIRSLKKLVDDNSRPGQYYN